MTPAPTAAKEYARQNGMYEQIGQPNPQQDRVSAVYLKADW